MRYRKCCAHLTESLLVDNKSVVALGAVLYTSANLPPPIDGAFYTVADRRTSAGAAAHITRMTTARHTHITITM